MIKYREILRLNAQSLSNRSIASSCGCSSNFGVRPPLSDYSQ